MKKFKRKKNEHEEDPEIGWGREDNSTDTHRHTHTHTQARTTQTNDDEFFISSWTPSFGVDGGWRWQWLHATIDVIKESRINVLTVCFQLNPAQSINSLSTFPVAIDTNVLRVILSTRHGSGQKIPTSLSLPERKSLAYSHIRFLIGGRRVELNYMQDGCGSQRLLMKTENKKSCKVLMEHL